MMNEQKANLPADLSHPKKGGEAASIWQSPSFFFFFLESSGKGYMYTALVLCKTVHSPQGPDAYHPLNLLRSRPDSSK